MYLSDEHVALIAHNGKNLYILPQMANRHGMIAGATGTGKTITLKVMAEAFSDMGVPVFMADIKGDLSGMAQVSDMNKHVTERVEQLKLKDFNAKAYPTRFFDVYGKQGIPVRTTISQMGPELLARIMNLNDTQKGILNIIFKIADDKKLLLIDLKDLRAMLQYVGDHNAEYKTSYGNISTASIGTIQRGLLQLEEEGAEVFFGEPELDLNDWLQTDNDGRGFINVLECSELFQHPLLYSTFLLWMLSDLYENLPEIGDMDKPKMVFFFDEAHLLFKDAPKALLDKIEQIVRLIRSKGIGVYFITQTPSDVPDSVLAQLGNRVQHALRAYTPNDQKAIKATAASFRANPQLDVEKALQELGTGEALVSFLDEKGAPSIVERAWILPPQSFMGMMDEAQKEQLIKGCPLYTKYQTAVDRESAFEDLQQMTTQDSQAQELAKKQAELDERESKLAAKEQAKAEKEAERAAAAAAKAAQKQKEQIVKTVTSTVGTIGKEVSRQLIRGLFGSLKR